MESVLVRKGESKLLVKISAQKVHRIRDISSYCGYETYNLTVNTVALGQFLSELFAY